MGDLGAEFCIFLFLFYFLKSSFFVLHLGGHTYQHMVLLHPAPFVWKLKAYFFCLVITIVDYYFEAIFFWFLVESSVVATSIRQIFISISLALHDNMVIVSYFRLKSLNAHDNNVLDFFYFLLLVRHDFT